MDIIDSHEENTSWWARYTHLVSKNPSVRCTFRWIFHSIAMKSINYLSPPLILPRLSLPLFINQIVALTDDSLPYSITSLSLSLLIALTLIAYSIITLGSHSYKRDV